VRSIPAALVCLALLCGCVMDPTYGDPYAAKAQAQGAIEATQAARAGMAAEATMGAGRTQDAMWISATQYAWAELAAQAMVTQEAAQALGTSQAIETATTWPKTATMGAQQALLEVQAMRATSTALGLEIRQAQEDRAFPPGWGSWQGRGITTARTYRLDVANVCVRFEK